MKDFLGNELGLYDKVVYADWTNFELKVGIIDHFVGNTAVMKRAKALARPVRRLGKHVVKIG